LDKEWLFGMGLRWYWEIFGHQGAGILRGGWIFLWCVLFFSIAHRLGADRWITALVFGLGAYSVLVVRMSVRPHTLGNLFVLVLFWLLTIPPKRWHLWAVLLLFVLWANIHGSFTVGGALLGAVGVWALWVPWWYRTRDPAFAAYAAQWRAWWWVLPVLPFVVCINPYGWRLWSVLWTFQREISSRPDPWVAPEWEAFSVTSPYANFLLGVLFLLAATWFLPERRRRSQWLLCMALGALLTFSNLRFVGLSFLILGPLLAAQLSLLKRPILRRLVVRWICCIGDDLGATGVEQRPTVGVVADDGERTCRSFAISWNATKGCECGYLRIFIRRGISLFVRIDTCRLLMMEIPLHRVFGRGLRLTKKRCCRPKHGTATATNIAARWFC
jgi:hypothetical protein